MTNQTQAKVKKTFRLKPELVELAKELSEQNLWTETVVIEQALKHYFISQGLLEADKPKTA
ncbi:MAG: hypothetical protein AAF208_06690 [Cyanobacteria bacterium P01_A01_bin.45]